MTKPTYAVLRRHYEQALGLQKPDTVIKNIGVLNFMTGEVEVTDIAIADGTIVSVYEPYDATGVAVIDGAGKFAVPGLINTHVHIESALLTPYEYERAVLPHGTTTTICDPHEAANVRGKPAVQFFLNSASGMVMDLRVQIPSSVPATPLETSGATLSAKDMIEFLDHPNTGGLAEVMNPSFDPETGEKIILFSERGIDGHEAGISGPLVNALRYVGLKNDHECVSAEEAAEKMKKDVQILVREGTVCKNGSTAPQGLTPIFNMISQRTASHMCFCTDDRKPHDIVREGDIDNVIRVAIAMGADVASTYRIATLSAAEHFGLKDRGLIAAGRKADILILNNLETCDIHSVMKDGRIINDASFAARPKMEPYGFGSMHMRSMSPDDFMLAAPHANTKIIGVVEGAIITEPLLYKNCKKEDMAKLAVIERHGKTLNNPNGGNIGLGWVQGLRLENCAIASTVAHDHHNLMIAGDNAVDMAVAANHLREIGGGFAIVRGGRVAAELSLPLMGLMSAAAYEDVVKDVIKLNETLKQVCKLESAFMYLSFLGLCVIPTLKLTDQGLTMFEPAKGDRSPRFVI